MTEWIKLHKNARNLTGLRFGRLVALGPIRRKRDKRGNPAIVWKLICDCGNTTETRSCNLLSGDTNSCGCGHAIIMRKTRTIHGKTKTPEYRAWANMISRCTDPNVDAFPYYGGRGIKVCDRWRNSFSNFYEDVGKKPSPKHSLDRIDSNGHYEQGNVRWADPYLQMGNRRTAHLITIDGKTLHMNEWCRRYNIKQGTVWDRINNGWDPARAVTTPVLKR